jgi:hypothetical protein
MVSVKLKVTVVPVNPVVVTTDPFFKRVTDVIPMGEFPDSVRVRLLKVTILPPGLVSCTCWTSTLEAPCGWEELEGGLVPWLACTVTGVGDGVGVTVMVKVGVEEAVALGVRLGVEDGVEVAEAVAVEEKVPVGV